MRTVTVSEACVNTEAGSSKTARIERHVERIKASSFLFPLE